MDKAKVKGRAVNRSELADFFGVSLPTIDTWVRLGCPVVQRGSRGVEWTFNTADVARWTRDRAAEEAAGTGKADVEELERREQQAKTGLTELRLAKERALVAPIAEFEKLWARAFATVTAGMRNIPGRVVSQLIGETDERRFKRILLEEIDLALTAAEEADLVDEEEQEAEGPGYDS